MSEYSKQLVAELTEHLDPEIIDFFEDTRNTINYEGQTLIELVEIALERYFKGETVKDELHKLFDLSMRNRRRKKQRWMDKLSYDVIHIPQSDSKYPFAHLVGQHKFMGRILWQSTYGSKTLDDLIDEHMAVANEWLSQTDSYFVSFPAIRSKTDAAINESILSDIILCSYRYILERYDGSIANYFLPMVKNLIGFPIFAPKKVKLTLSVEDNQVIEKYNYGEGVLETALTESVETLNEQLVSMDQNDLLILYAALQNLDVDFYTTRQAHVKKRTLVKLFNDRPGKKHYDKMEDRCHKLSKYNFNVAVDGKPKFSFNLLDSVDTRDPEEVVFYFGNLLFDSIIANNITNIKSSHMELLNNNLSTILYQSLFKERIILSANSENAAEDLCKDYTYSFFSCNVRFPNQTRKKNMDLVETSLKEFVDNKIIVKSYERKTSDRFRIYFYPLSEEEISDLNFNRYKNIQVLPGQDDEEII